MKIVDRLRKKIIFNFTSPQTRFKEIFRNNFWESSESVSGPGSTMENTQSVRAILPFVFTQYKIKSMLDIPCGDFYWMNTIDLQNINYNGADIVPELIKINQSKYPDHQFIVSNLIEDKLPSVDLIFSRDCLIHLSNKLILNSLKNIKQNNAKYFLTNTYPDIKQNTDIKTGTWRRINLQISPFNLPTPVETFEEKEHYTEACGRKLLCLWQISYL